MTLGSTLDAFICTGKIGKLYMAKYMVWTTNSPVNPVCEACGKVCAVARQTSVTLLHASACLLSTPYRCMILNDENDGRCENVLALSSVTF